ncbi:hypothetical protein EJB05_40525, partial [Eragrostis curvula]
MASSLTVLSLLLLAMAAAPSLLSEASSVEPRVPRGVATAEAFRSAINEARANVSVPLVSWNATVARAAKAQVSWVRSSGGCDPAQVDKSPVPLVWSTTSYTSPDRRTPSDAVWSWVSERQWYDHASNTCAAGKQCGDYTIVVKRAWQQVGCALVACASGGTVMACDYSPGTNRMPDPKEPPY